MGIALFRMILCLGTVLILTVHASALPGAVGANAPFSPTTGIKGAVVNAWIEPAWESKEWPAAANAHCHSYLSIVGKPPPSRVAALKGKFAVCLNNCVTDAILELIDKPPDSRCL